jgi:hypothetical protein
MTEMEVPLSMKELHHAIKQGKKENPRGLMALAMTFSKRRGIL